MDDLSDIQAISLRNVIKADTEDYLLRKIFRSYSKSFSTPLHIVETLPLCDVLLHFFENMFEEMEKKALEDVRLDVIETDKEVQIRQRQEDQIDAETFEVAQQIIKEEKADLGKMKLPKEKEGAMAAIRGLSREVSLIGDELMKEIREAPEGISMKFDDSYDDFDRDSFGLMDEPKKR